MWRLMRESPPCLLRIEMSWKLQKWGGSGGGDHRPRLTVKLSLNIPFPDHLENIRFGYTDSLLHHITWGLVMVWIVNTHGKRNERKGHCPPHEIITGLFIVHTTKGLLGVYGEFLIYDLSDLFCNYHFLNC